VECSTCEAFTELTTTAVEIETPTPSPSPAVTSATSAPAPPKFTATGAATKNSGKAQIGLAIAAVGMIVLA